LRPPRPARARPRRAGWSLRRRPLRGNRPPAPPTARAVTSPVFERPRRSASGRLSGGPGRILPSGRSIARGFRRGYGRYMGDEGARVIGAGAAGLATAGMLQRAGVKTVVLERSDRVGSSWVSRYDSLRLNTLRSMSQLPGYECDRAYGAFPSAHDWVAYLERY